MSWFKNPIPGVWNALITAAPVKVWAQVGAAMVLTGLSAWRTWIIWMGPWEKTHQAQQLNAIFYQSIGGDFLILVALVAMTGLSVNIHAGKDGLNAGIDQDDAKPVEVVTTTKTTVTPAPPPDPDPTLTNGPRE